MNQADLEDLIVQSTEQAKTMTERARKGIEGLALIEQTASEAAHKLETEVAHTRSVIATTSKLLDDLQLELDKRDSDVHKALVVLEEGSSRIERDVASASDTLRKANASLITRADESAKLLQRQLLACQKELEGLRGFAGAELGKLRTYTTDVSTLVVALRAQAATSETQLKKAFDALILEHEQLDRAFDKQLVALEQTYDLAVNATEKRLQELEVEVGKLTTAADLHLDEVLVKKLGVELRKAADTFGSDLGAIEREVNQIVTSLGTAHRGFRDNFAKAVQPGIADMAKGLFDAAQNLGWV